MNHTRVITKNLLFLMAAQVVAKLAGYIVVAYLARTLLPVNFGKLSFAQSICTYFQMFVNLGLEVVGTREVARDPSQARTYLSNILTMRLLLALGAFVLLYLTAMFVIQDRDTAQLLVYLGFTLPAYAITAEWYFQGTERMSIVALGRIAQQVIFAALILWFVGNAQDLMIVPMLRAVSLALSAGVLLVCIVYAMGSIPFRIDLSQWKSLLEPALPIGFSLLMITVYYNSDTIVLGIFHDDSVVGWYNAAYKAVFVLLLPVEAIRTAFFPGLARLDHPSSVHEAASSFARTMFTLGVPLGIGGIVLAPGFIDLVYGPAYERAVVPFQLLCINVILVFVNDTYGGPLLAWGKQGVYAKAVTISALANLALNFLFIPRFDMVGAAVATILAELIAFAGVYREYQKMVPLGQFRHAVPPLLSAAIMAGVLASAQLVTTHFVLLVLLGMAVYFISLTLLGGMRVSDVMILLFRKPASSH